MVDSVEQERHHTGMSHNDTWEEPERTLTNVAKQNQIAHDCTQDGATLADNLADNICNKNFSVNMLYFVESTIKNVTYWCYPYF